jgi:phage terminase small subunit
MAGPKNTADKPLSPKHLRFCQEYLQDLNATQAAIRAGYSPNIGTARVTAHDLMRKPNIKKYIDDALQKAGFNERVFLEELAKTALGEADGKKLKSADKNAATALLFKVKGIGTEKVEVSGTFTPILQITMPTPKKDGE